MAIPEDLDRRCPDRRRDRIDSTAGGDRNRCGVACRNTTPILAVMPLAGDLQLLLDLRRAWDRIRCRTASRRVVEVHSTPDVRQCDPRREVTSGDGSGSLVRHGVPVSARGAGRTGARVVGCGRVVPGVFRPSRPRSGMVAVLEFYLWMGNIIQLWDVMPAASSDAYPPLERVCRQLLPAGTPVQTRARGVLVSGPRPCCTTWAV
ncbi:hypothetical protein EV641_106229 [Rhodococcus sp. SMB37]|nr:hypothetical protein EV641_106229 [Rhodococcus sp. SMB37]